MKSQKEMIIIVAILLCSCSVLPSLGDSPISITDSSGHTVNLERLPERILITGRANFMILDAVYLFPDVNEKIIAIAKSNQSALTFLPLIDKGIYEKAVIENNAGPEQIAAFNPDLVILKNSTVDSLGQPLETLGIPVVYQDLETPEAFYQDVQVLGQLFGDPDRAEMIINYYRSRMDSIQELVSISNVIQKPDVLILKYNNEGGEIAFNVPPATWLQTIMVETVGGNPIWIEAGVGDGWSIVTLDQIAVWDPDQIYIIDYQGGASQVVADLKNDPFWKELRSVQNAQIFAFPYDFYSWDQPDTRWILGMQWLMTKIQPQLASQIDILAEVETFYSQLYQLDADTIKTGVIPLLTGDIP